MRATAIVLVCLALAVCARAGDNPDVNIYLEFQNGENYIEPTPNSALTVTIYLENFGSGGGTSGVEFMLVRTFPGFVMSESTLPSGWFTLGDSETGWSMAGPCAMPDGDGRVAVAQVTYWYTGGTGTIDFANNPTGARTVVDCGVGDDQWCVRLSPSGNGGVYETPPPGDCPGFDPHPHRWDVPSEMATIQAAIDAAAYGDTVYVAPGTYATSTNGESFPIVLDKNNIRIMSESGAEVTIIDAEGQYHAVLECEQADSTVIDGFSIVRSRTVGVGCTSSFTKILNCIFREHEGSGVLYIDNSSVAAGPSRVEWCVFEENFVDDFVLFEIERDHLTVSDCVFHANVVDHGSVISANEEINMTRCRIGQNECFDLGGGGAPPVISIVSGPGTARLEDCTVDFNSSGYGSGGPALLYEGSGDLLVSGCTFGFVDSWIRYDGAGSAVFQNTIVAFNAAPNQPAVQCTGTGDLSLSCCNIFGNEGGDWVGCIADQYGTNGNVSVDPLFCELWYDSTLCADSWCAAENNPGCGQIGAGGIGCGDCGFFHIPPTILDVTDVGDDQGGKVRLRWLRSTFDAPNAPYEITSYEVYRRQGALRDGDGKGPGAETTADGMTGRSRINGWDYVATVPIHGDSVYQYVAPTLCDSTAEGGFCWSTFLIRGTTPDPYTYFDSPPDSGYSVDNLAPAPPAGLLADGDESLVTLTWDASEDEDFDYYAIYRDVVEGFELGTPIGYTSEPTFEDESPPAAPEWWYKVTAFDFGGNESGPSGEAGVVSSGVTEALPTRFWLGPATPTPFLATTEIQYWVPAGEKDCHVGVTVYDARGRVVRHLVDGQIPPGSHTVVWDGKEDGGSPAASGVYFYSMEAGDYSNKRKMVLLR